VDDQVHLATGRHAAVWLPVCMPVYMPDGYRRRPILLLLLLLVVVAGLLACGVAAVELMLNYFHV